MLVAPWGERRTQSSWRHGRLLWPRLLGRPGCSPRGWSWVSLSHRRPTTSTVSKMEMNGNRRGRLRLFIRIVSVILFPPTQYLPTYWPTFPTTFLLWNYTDLFTIFKKQIIINIRMFPQPEWKPFLRLLYLAPDGRVPGRPRVWTRDTRGPRIRRTRTASPGTRTGRWRLAWRSLCQMVPQQRWTRWTWLS